MKRILIVVLLLVVVLGAALPTFAQSSPVASVITGSLNVRTGPGMQYGSIATLPFGFGVNMVARNTQGNWILIALTNGVDGWVNVQYLFTQFPTNSLPVSDSPVPATVTPTATITGVLAADVRVGPSTNNAVIDTVALGTQVNLLGRDYTSMWGEVQLPDGTVGWVAGSSLNSTVPIRGLALADGSVFVPFAPSLPLTSSTTTSGSPHTYVVQPGDTLWAIAQHFNVSITALAAANDIWNYNLIYSNQQLIIPS